MRSEIPLRLQTVEATGTAGGWVRAPQVPTSLPPDLPVPPGPPRPSPHDAWPARPPPAPVRRRPDPRATAGAGTPRTPVAGAEVTAGGGRDTECARAVGPPRDAEDIAELGRAGGAR